MYAKTGRHPSATFPGKDMRQYSVTTPKLLVDLFVCYSIKLYFCNRIWVAMRVYYYHTVDIHGMYEGWRNGSFPGHFLYGATHLTKYGMEVVLHQPIRPRQRWKLSVHTAWTILTRGGYDVLYATTFRGLEIIIFLRALRLFRRPVVVWHHQPVVRSGNPLRELAARLFYRGIDEMLFFSEKMVSDSLASVKADPERMHVVHWGADLDYYDRLMEKEGTRLREGFVSTGKEMRDMPTLVRAFSGSGAKLDIYICREYGGTDYEGFFRRCSTGSETTVHYVDGVVHGEMSRMVNRSACVVVCCKETNYTVGLTTVVEAMALGLPMICSRNPQMPVDIDREGCGITVGYGDVDGWKKAIAYMCGHPDEARRMGERGRALAERLYNVGRCARDVREILGRLDG